MCRKWQSKLKQKNKNKKHTKQNKTKQKNSHTNQCLIHSQANTSVLDYREQAPFLSWSRYDKKVNKNTVFTFRFFICIVIVAGCENCSFASCCFAYVVIVIHGSRVFVFLQIKRKIPSVNKWHLATSKDIKSTSLRHDQKKLTWKQLNWNQKCVKCNLRNKGIYFQKMSLTCLIQTAFMLWS